MFAVSCVLMSHQYSLMIVVLLSGPTHEQYYSGVSRCRAAKQQYGFHFFLESVRVVVRVVDAKDNGHPHTRAVLFRCVPLPSDKTTESLREPGPPKPAVSSTQWQIKGIQWQISGKYSGKLVANIVANHAWDTARALRNHGNTKETLKNPLMFSSELHAQAILHVICHYICH